jgi:zinc transporter 9
MHTMQENGAEVWRRDSNINGYADGRESSQRAKKSLRELIASVIGMILPLLLQIGHAH